MRVASKIPRKSAKREIEKLALETERQAWDETNPVAALKLVERLNTLNLVAKRMEWWTVNARLQRSIDRLTAASTNIEPEFSPHGSTA